MLSGPTYREESPIADNSELFDCMLRDGENAPPLYKATNYWDYYQDAIIQAIKNEGLSSFRSSKCDYFSAFGASDLHPIKAPVGAIKGLFPKEEEAKKYIGYLSLVAKNPDSELLPCDLSLNDLLMTAYRMADASGALSGALPLSRTSSSLIGNPEYSFAVEGRNYTLSTLNYYLRYCFCCRSIDFGSIDTIVELGMGSGKQAELVAKLYPSITYYLLDLPPQAYLAGQYLRAIFGERVNDYGHFRGVENIEAEEGTLNILCNWQIGAVRPKGNVLFWNAASFQEMEPHVVEHYLSIAAKWSERLYLHQAMRGKESGEKGKGGVITKTTFEEYETFLTDSHSLLAREKAYAPLKELRDSGGYEETMWGRIK